MAEGAELITVYLSLDLRRHPASDLITLYRQRWEIETADLN